MKSFYNLPGFCLSCTYNPPCLPGFCNLSLKDNIQMQDWNFLARGYSETWIARGYSETWIQILWSRGERVYM